MVFYLCSSVLELLLKPISSRDKMIADDLLIIREGSLDPLVPIERSFPLTEDGIRDMSYILDAEDLDDSPSRMDELPAFVVMCRAVSRSDSPLLINPAIYRGYHSFEGIRRVGIQELPADFDYRPFLKKDQTIADFSVDDFLDDSIFWDLPSNGERTDSCGPCYTNGNLTVAGCISGSSVLGGRVYGSTHYGYLQR